jgi:hypothetical protein
VSRRNLILSSIALAVMGLVLTVVAGWIALAAAACVISYLWGHASITAVGDRLAAGQDQVNAKIAELERQLAEARQSAELAWDAAAERPPAAPSGSDSDRRADLLADAYSGARPLLPS